MFDACVYINLDRNTERNAAFQRRWRAVSDWPFPEPQRLPGVIAEPPSWWLSGTGSWCCYLAHLRVYEYALMRGYETIAIFEDDAVFADGFSVKVREFAAKVPDDWGLLYLGGNHYRKPYRVAPGVVKCSTTTGLWAYVVHRRAMAMPWQTLARFPMATRDDNCHIDTTWGSLQKWRKVNAYGPDHWMAGHAQGISERTGLLCETDYYFQLTEAALASLPTE
jgi:hypothetical protein